MKLQLAGIELKFYALRGLGELNQAREIAQIMLSLVQGLNLKEKITEWEMLLASVSDESD